MTRPGSKAPAAATPAASPAAAPGTTGWEDPPRAELSRTGAPVLAVNGFQGPLDWLVELAAARRIDLRRLPFLALVEAFAAALERALGRDGGHHARGAGENAGTGRADLARWGDWLVMAARLAELRSRLLLPPGDGQRQSAQDEAERLRRGLAGRAALAAAADWLERQPQLGRDVFARGSARAGRDGRAGENNQADAAGAAFAATAPGKGEESRAGPVQGDLTGLLRACLAALRQQPGAGEAWQPGPPLWNAADARSRILRRLSDQGEEAPFAAVLPGIGADAPRRDWRCRVAVAAFFAAGLELARDGTVTLEQDGAWKDIQVKAATPRNGVDA